MDPGSPVGTPGRVAGWLLAVALLGLLSGLASGTAALRGVTECRSSAAAVAEVAGLRAEVSAVGREEPPAAAETLADLRLRVARLDTGGGRLEGDLAVRLDALLAQVERHGVGGPQAAVLLGEAGDRARELESLLGRRAADAANRVRRLLVAVVGSCAIALLAGLGGALRGRGRGGAPGRTPDENLTELLATAIRSTEEGVLISDTGGPDREPTIVFVNRALCSMTGFSDGEMVGQPLRVLRSKYLRENEFEVLEHPSSDSKSATVETVRLRDDGSQVHCEWHISPVRARDGRVTHFVSVLSDVTRLREQEAAQRRSHDELLAAHRQLQENQRQLVQSEKMAFLGQLAAGVAHEINNPVGYAMSNLETLAGDLGEVIPVLRRAREALEAAEGDDQVVALLRETVGGPELSSLLEDVEPIVEESRAGLLQVRDIVQGLKNFARPDDGVTEDADLNREVENALKLVWNELKHRVTVTRRLGELPPVPCRPRQVGQVLTNLLVNAAQAIRESGEITIETGVEGGSAVVRIADSGEGILPEHMDLLFAPFFTTKPAGKGTGLGLAVSYGIVQKHRGTIEVQSEVGKGTVFTVRLPLARER